MVWAIAVYVCLSDSKTFIMILEKHHESEEARIAHYILFATLPLCE